MNPAIIPATADPTRGHGSVVKARARARGGRSAETRDRENVLLDQFSPSKEETSALHILY